MEDLRKVSLEELLIIFFEISFNISEINRGRFSEKKNSADIFKAFPEKFSKDSIEKYFL